MVRRAYKQERRSIAQKGFSFVRQNLLFCFLLLTSLLFILRNVARNHLLKTSSLVAQAVVIPYKNYLGNNNVAGNFTYSYRFMVDGEEYFGNTLSSKYRVDDKVKIKYVPAYPDFNEIEESE